ncbi:DUF3822 family protein [Ichthyenterobacterium magnum]|uniref:DUF3822 family protein n=1 Tax=Ichthyenterobacterium magnum TaxID=1230530 RepID=UPI001FE934B7|nr:DUF3822 family protein [Ichthyenterobacterium magnum]
MNTNSIKALSIQINLSGLSFCVLNRTTNTIEHLKTENFDKKLTPFEILERLKTVLDTNSIFSESFETVLIIYKNELSSLVPKALFSENNLADYLKFNTKILKTDYITYDELPINKSVNVYVPLVNINNYIFESYGAFDYKHASTLFIDTLLQKKTYLKKDAIYINADAYSIEIVVLKNSKIQLYNTFEYGTKEDFIYYILFVIEQLKLNPEEINAVLSGQIAKDDELYNIVYKYIRHVAFVNPEYTYNYNESMQPDFTHNYFILLNSFN